MRRSNFVALAMGIVGTAAAMLAIQAGVAYAQSYPSQPTFLKWGLGIGPNTTEVQTQWGGTTPLGFGVIAQQTDGTGGEILMLARETGVDPQTDRFSLGVGLNGSLGEFFIGSEAGLALELFPAADGLSNNLALGDAATGSTIELRANSIRRSALPAYYLDEDDAAANERRTLAYQQGGQFFVASETDAGGAGSTFIAANRNGTAWDSVVFSSTGLIGLNGTQTQGPAGSAGTPSYSFLVDTDTGFYRVGANQVGIAVGGSNVFTCDSTGCTGAGVSPVYGGWTDNAATAEHVPAGWSVSLTGSTFTWTHNLGLPTADDLAVTVTPQVGSSEACRVNAINTNSFDVICYTTSTGSAANVAHFVNAIRVAN